MPTVIVLGIMMSDCKGSGAGEEVTFTVADAEDAVPSGFVNIAVIVVWPGLAPVTIPVVAPTEATDGAVEIHEIPVASVTSSFRPVVPEVPSAMNCPV